MPSEFWTLFTTTHLEDKYEVDSAELDGQLDVAILMAKCTICKAKVAECCGARACARPSKPLETRAKMIEERKSTIPALGFSEPVPVALGLWMTH